MLTRCLDIAVSLSLLLLLCVPLGVICLILRLTQEGEVFFLQERVGYRKQIFRITKFVTMRKDSPTTGSKDITLPNDPRIFRLGRVLRKTKINELPQLYDVLRGKMSLVGWRPLMPQGFANYSPEVQAILATVKPGLTGIGSLVFRHEEAIVTRAAEQGQDVQSCYREFIMPYKGELEVWYVAHQGTWTDFKIIACTAISLFRPGWTGYLSWFPGLPRPQASILQEVLGVRGPS